MSERRAAPGSAATAPESLDEQIARWQHHARDPALPAASRRAALRHLLQLRKLREARGG